jgi:cholera toxin transcriptional activator
MQPQTSPSARVVRFGIFEVDLLAGELRRKGARIHLQEQPFQVLAVLLERSGDVVTREELRQKVWPADTFVDFDHSLNTAINKIRDALGDSATAPKFIETLARRGYRFIAPVQLLAASPSKSTHPDLSASGAQAGNTAALQSASASMENADMSSLPHPEPHPELDLPIPHRRLSRGLFALIQVMYLSFYLAALFRLREIDRIADSFVPGGGAFALLVAVLVTAGIGIPLRCYLLSAVAFDYSGLAEKFGKLFVFVLLLDSLWAVAPFLLMEKIGLGPAFAATAGLLYLPFSERTLVRMAYSRVRD